MSRQRLILRRGNIVGRNQKVVVFNPLAWIGGLNPLSEVVKWFGRVAAMRLRCLQHSALKEHEELAC